MFILSQQLQSTSTNTKEDQPMGVGSQEDPSSQRWPEGLTPLQLAFAEAERSQQEADRASKERVSSKKVRGPCRRISCKARGVSAKHNADTGFFDVPLDAPHGMLLVCSHPECIASCRRFRYCVVCEMPFAMRNFLKRHGHGMVQSGKELKDRDVDNLSCPVVANSSSSPTIVAPTDQSQLVRRHKRVVSFDKSSSTKKAISIDDNEQHWLQLLRQRPDTEDQTKMTTWMAMVISCSEQTSKPGKKNTTQEVESSSPITVTTPPSPVTPPTASTDMLEPLPFAAAETVDDFDFSTVFDD